jgi:hypothetical protein
LAGGFGSLITTIGTTRRDAIQAGQMVSRW